MKSDAPIVKKANYSRPKDIEVNPYVKKIDWNNLVLDMGYDEDDRV